MARYSLKDAKVEFDNSGGTLVDMSQYVTDEFGTFVVEATLEENTGVGDTWEEHVDTGLRSVSELAFSGKYDDAATTGPDVIFNSLGAQRTLKITWGGTKTSSVETMIKSYERMGKRGALTLFKVNLVPTGAVTEA